MATVKVILDKNETEEEAKEMLLKALTAHESGSLHQEDFHQPAAREVSDKLLQEHDLMFERMLKQIFAVLEE